MKKFLIKTLLIFSTLIFVFSSYGCRNNNQSNSTENSSLHEVTITVNNEEINYQYFSYNGEELNPTWETVVDIAENSHYLSPITAGEKSLVMDFDSQSPICNLAYMFILSKSGNTSSYQEDIFDDFQTEENKQTVKFSIPETLNESNDLLFIVISANWENNVNGEYFIGFQLL